MGKKLFIFDMDGTLTESKRPLTKVQADTFSSFAQKHKTAVISGAEFSQMRKQFISKLPKGKKTPEFIALPVNGGEMWVIDKREWKRVYQKPFSPPLKRKVREAIKKMEKEFDEILPKKKWGAVVEDRGSQITYSALGAKAPISAKHKWDPKEIKRLKMSRYIKKLLPQCEVGVAGMTSIDITPKGLTKEFGVRSGMRFARVTAKDTVFIGDAVFKGGNDAPAIRTGASVMKVKNPKETYALIRDIVNVSSKIGGKRLRT